MSRLRGNVYRTEDSWTKRRRSTRGHIARLREGNGIGDGLRDDGEDGVATLVSSGALLSMLDIVLRLSQSHCVSSRNIWPSVRLWCAIGVASNVRYRDVAIR